jgi:hypothetical protein
MKSQNILPPSKVFDRYSKEIAKFRAQQEKRDLFISSVLEIGKLLQEVRRYKSQSTAENINELWKIFTSSLSISKSSISKYLSIYQNSTIRSKKYQKHLPNSFVSLYQLSKMADGRLAEFVELGSVNQDMGRGDVDLLIQDKSKIKTQTVKEIEILNLKLPIDSWEEKFQSIRTELIQFLDLRGIQYEYGEEIQKREKLELKQSNNVRKHVFTQLKKHYTKKIKEYIDQRLRDKNLLKKGQSLSFKKKSELIGFNFDEIDCSSDTLDDEIKERFIGMGIGDEQEWNVLVGKFLDEAFEKYPPPKHLVEICAELVKVDESSLPIKRSRKIDKSKLKGFKF